MAHVAGTPQVHGSWFHGTSSKRQAGRLLKRTAIPNAFLVWRDSKGKHVLSFKVAGQRPLVQHREIIRLSNSTFQLAGMSNAFPDLRGVVVDFRDSMRSAGGLVPIDQECCPCDVVSTTPYPLSAMAYQQCLPSKGPVEPPPSYHDVVSGAQRQAQEEGHAGLRSETVLLTEPDSTESSNVDEESCCSARCWGRCLCMCNTEEHKWYDVRGKGLFPIIFLVIGYIICGVLFLLLALIYCAIWICCPSYRD